MQRNIAQPNCITIFLMTEKGYEFLYGIPRKYRSLINLIVVGSDKSIKKDYEEEIIQYCIKNYICFIKKSEFKAIKTEYAMAISWRWLIKHPAQKLIIFHDSLLPKYRGFSPLINSLINGDSEIGVSAIFGADNFDAGAVITQSKSSITYPLKISEAIQINNKNYYHCAEFIFNKLLNNLPLTAKKQDETSASYSVWRDESDYEIDWSKSANEILRFIDAVGFPYKGASTRLDGRLIRILSAEEVPNVAIENRHHGKVLFLNAGKPIVICGKGLLKITEANIELEGKATSIFPLAKFRIRFTN